MLVGESGNEQRALEVKRFEAREAKRRDDEDTKYTKLKEAAKHPKQSTLFSNDTKI